MSSFQFENAPVSLWEEDYTEIIKLLDSLSIKHKNNLDLYFEQYPQELERFISTLKIINVNQASVEFLEARDKDELIQNLPRVFTDDSRLVFIEELKHILQGIYQYDFKTKLKTLRGKDLSVNLRIQAEQRYSENIAYDRVLVAITDITELENSKIAILAEQKRTQKYLNQANVLFASFDRQGQVISTNTKLRNLLGISLPDINGQTWFNYVPRDERSVIQDIFEELLSGKMKAVENINGHVISQSGAMRPVEWSFSALHDEKDENIEILASGMDLTHQQSLEQSNLQMQSQLQQSQKLNSISVLARGVAHEINNPLTGLLNYANILEDEITDPELRDFAQGIQKEGTRVANIVSNLLTFARLDTGSKTPALVEEVIDRAVMLIKQSLLTDNINLEIQAIEEGLKTFCKIQDMQQVILNILTNSWNAINNKDYESSTEKKITISVEPEQNEEEEYVQIKISDNGNGIKKEYLDSVFDPFFSVHSRAQHAGMGLAVAYGIVSDHSGYITIESVYGEGTVVIVGLVRHIDEVPNTQET